jgi:hypothetical protein
MSCYLKKLLSLAFIPILLCGDESFYAHETSPIEKIIFKDNGINVIPKMHVSLDTAHKKEKVDYGYDTQSGSLSVLRRIDFSDKNDVDGNITITIETTSIHTLNVLLKPNQDKLTARLAEVATKIKGKGIEVNFDVALIYTIKKVFALRFSPVTLDINIIRSSFPLTPQDEDDLVNFVKLKKIFAGMGIKPNPGSDLTLRKEHFSITSATNTNGTTSLTVTISAADVKLSITNSQNAGPEDKKILANVQMLREQKNEDKHLKKKKLH